MEKGSGRKKDGIIPGWLARGAGVYHESLEMLLWDMPTYKVCFVSFPKDRTLGQSRPGLTEI